MTPRSRSLRTRLDHSLPDHVQNILLPTMPHSYDLSAIACGRINMQVLPKTDGPPPAQSTLSNLQSFHRPCP
jgi:hypothetical protein